MSTRKQKMRSLFFLKKYQKKLALSHSQPYSFPAMQAIQIPNGQQVRVYFNLHKKMLSVQTKQNGQWKLAGHAENVYLHNVAFKVSEAGRQRVIKNKRKNVHAYIIGHFTDGFKSLELDPFLTVRYNPYEMDKFQCQNKNISSAKTVIINGRHVYAQNPQ